MNKEKFTLKVSSVDEAEKFDMFNMDYDSIGYNFVIK